MNRRTSRRKTLISAALTLVLPIAGRALAQEGAPSSSEPPPLTGRLYPELDAAAADALAALEKQSESGPLWGRSLGFTAAAVLPLKAP